MSKCSSCGMKECCGGAREEEIELLQSKLEKAVEALENYGEHTSDCILYIDETPKCNCGFQQALDEIRGGEK